MWDADELPSIAHKGVDHSTSACACRLVTSLEWSKLGRPFLK